MKVLLDHHLKKQGILLWATMGDDGQRGLAQIAGYSHAHL